MDPKASAFVLGQRYTLATVALVVALLSFLNLAGIEKAILAVVLGARALTSMPEPGLEQRRRWAHIAVGLAVAHVVLLTTIILLNLERLPRLYEVFRALSDLQ
jgi:hypothetical protein